MMRFVPPALVLLALWIGNVGCFSDFSPCLGHPGSESEVAPIIESFSMVGQLDDDPWTVIFKLSFRDLDGNVGKLGSLKVFLNSDKELDALELRDLFQASRIELESKAGDMALPLRFEHSQPESARVLVGVQLVDGDGLRSQCASLDLSLIIK